MSYYAQSISSVATSVASSGQALKITWEGNQYSLQPTMRTYISGLINRCASAMSMESPPYYPYHAHLMSGLHGSHSDATKHYTFKIWAQRYVTKNDVNPQGHTSAEKFCFVYHYYEDNTNKRWACAVEDVPSSTNTQAPAPSSQPVTQALAPSSQPTTASNWVWDDSYQDFRKVVDGKWVWRSRGE